MKKGNPDKKCKSLYEKSDQKKCWSTVATTFLLFLSGCAVHFPHSELLTEKERVVSKHFAFLNTEKDGVLSDFNQLEISQAYVLADSEHVDWDQYTNWGLC